MNNVLTISGVRGYINENGTVMINLEDATKGLGFIKEETKGRKKYTSIRWDRVFGYLDDFSFDHKWSKELFIPENIFYRLAMKANNAVAEKFQSIVCDEILPEIRKTGSYQAKELSPLEVLQNTVGNMHSMISSMIETDRRLKEVEIAQEKITEQSSVLTNKVNAQDDIINAVKDTIVKRDDNWRTSINHMLRCVGNKMDDYRAPHKIAHKTLESRARCKLDTRIKNHKKRLEIRGICQSNIDRVSNLDVIEADPKLKEIYLTVVKELYIAYVS